MGTSLINTKPQDTYPGLIKTTDNAAISATLKTLSDGNGNDFPMQISTTAVNFTGTLTQNGSPVTTPPSGVSGAIQFSNGSAFASDAANLFWDDANNRLGIGTNAPTNTFEIASTTTAPFKVATTASYFRAIFQNSGASGIFDFNASSFQFPTNNVEFGTSSSLGARVGIKGSGSTSATTSLLVQNSAGNTGLEIKDDRSFVIGNFGANGAGLGILAGNPTGAGVGGGINFNFNNGAAFNDDTNNSALKMAYNGGVRIPNSSRYPLTLGSDTKAVASAQLEMVSTTQGFLPPRMTTTQKNAIASPASGLVVYDSTTNKLCCYNGSTWNDLF